MNSERPVVLVAGATGRTGRLVVEAADRHGLRARALARDPDRARSLVPAAEVVQGDLEDLSTLTGAVSGIDAVIFAHGSDQDARPGAFARIDYGGVAPLTPSSVPGGSTRSRRATMRSSSSKATRSRQECRASRSRRPSCAAC